MVYKFKIWFDIKKRLIEEWIVKIVSYDLRNIEHQLR